MAKKDLTSLVIKAQSGDSQALSDLMEASYEILYYYAYKAVGDPDLAGDITQESCIEIINTIQNLRDPAAFRTWSGKIVYHQCTKHFKQVKEVPLSENEDGETILDQLPDENPGSLPEQVQEDKEFQQTIMAMIDQLPAAQRTALMLYYYENLSVTQIAEIQSTTEGTVKSRLNYGRKAVKKEVEAYEKKSGVRLHSIVPLPLLLSYLFGKDATKVTHSASKTLAALGANVASAAASNSTVAATATATAAVSGISAKIVALIVAAVVGIGAVVGTLLSHNPPADTPEEETTQETATEPSDSPLHPSYTGTLEQWSFFYGTWYGGVDNAPILEFSEGKLQITGRTFSWSLEDCFYDEEGGFASLELFSPDETCYLLTFNLEEDGHWSAEVQEVIPTDDPNLFDVPEDGEFYYLYCPTDYDGYTVVTLTPENVMDYIVYEANTYEYYTDEQVSGLMQFAPQGFRQGLGSGSYCQMFPLIRNNYFEATAQEAIAGQKTPTGRSYTYVDCTYPSHFYRSAIDSFGEVITLDPSLDEKITLIETELLGAIFCQGYVLVPEDYEIPARAPAPEATWMQEIWGLWESPTDSVEEKQSILVSPDLTVSINGIGATITNASYSPAENGSDETIYIDLAWDDPAQGIAYEEKITFLRHNDGQLILRFTATDPLDPSNYFVYDLYQYSKYQKIELTAENYFDYVDFSTEIQYETYLDEFGNVEETWIRYGTVFHFKEGVGAPSHAHATLLGTCTIYETAFNGSGAVTDQKQLSQQESDLILSMSAHFWYQFYGPHDYLLVEEDLPCTVTWENWSDLLVDNCYGVIYIPIE